MGPFFSGLLQTGSSMPHPLRTKTDFGSEQASKCTCYPMNIHSHGLSELQACNEKCCNAAQKKRISGDWTRTSTSSFTKTFRRKRLTSPYSTRPMVGVHVVTDCFLLDRGSWGGRWNVPTPLRLKLISRRCSRYISLGSIYL